MSYTKFGAAGSVESEDHEYNADQLEWHDGFDTDLFPLKFTDVLTRDKPSSCAATYGIGKSDDMTRNSLGLALDSVTMVEAEEITPPHMLATQPDTEPALGDKLTYTDGLIFTRKKITITITGRGELPTGLQPGDRGKTYADELLLKPAVGDAPAIQESNLFIAPLRESKKSTDWRSFTITLTKYVGNTVANARVNMITPSLFTKAELDAISPWYKITRTTTLSGTGPANIQESVEIYDSSSSP